MTRRGWSWRREIMAYAGDEYDENATSDFEGDFYDDWDSELEVLAEATSDGKLKGKKRLSSKITTTSPGSDSPISPAVKQDPDPTAASPQGCKTLLQQHDQRYRVNVSESATDSVQQGANLHTDDNSKVTETTIRTHKGPCLFPNVVGYLQQGKIQLRAGQGPLTNKARVPFAKEAHAASMAKQRTTNELCDDEEKKDMHDELTKKRAVIDLTDDKEAGYGGTMKMRRTCGLSDEEEDEYRGLTKKRTTIELSDDEKDEYGGPTKKRKLA
ncbi:uncharacterized protein LTR77_010781 [Saxophila tyrrhenica]|uniref:Uncharacterized protein n=1 Tax=Saxophila tyrrhenica TaxID=1690608 RepID=A0AAV9NWF8_9PEZI|nr:hypothetical protein LTR77_010781 [Saxophila tyrrhenica]